MSIVPDIEGVRVIEDCCSKTVTLNLYKNRLDFCVVVAFFVSGIAYTEHVRVVSLAETRCENWGNPLS